MNLLTSPTTGQWGECTKSQEEPPDLVTLRHVNLHMTQTSRVSDIITDLVLTAELEASYLGRTAT